MKRIQSKNHKIGTYEIDKISLSCFHDKRYMLDDGIQYGECARGKKILIKCHCLV